MCFGQRVRSRGLPLAGLPALPRSPYTLVESFDGTSWSIQPSPAIGTSNALSGVSCPSANSCTAVGFFENFGGPQTLVESWNGTAWSVVPSPNSGTASNYLGGVSCVSAMSCMAVGHSFNISSWPGHTLVESWNGTAWSVVPSPNTGTHDNTLSGVSCVSPTSCEAAGSNDNSGNFGFKPSQTLIESWDGSVVSIGPSADAVSTVYNSLNGVSCVSPTACIAVGTYYNGVNVSFTLAESWNGTAWSVMPSPNGGFGYLNGVSCVSATSCVAVGSLIESWNGTAWTVMPSPGGGPLVAVSCVSATSCMAVGNSYNTGTRAYQTLIESWDGTTWTVAPSPNRGIGDFLSGVSCTSARVCEAVGRYYTTCCLTRTLVESWNGTDWSVVPSPNRGTNNDNSLFAVSCTSARVCKAVGESGYISVAKTLVESWNGTAWSVVRSPNLGTISNSLYAVSCTASSSCMAVGEGIGGPINSLTESWNGTTWSIVPNHVGNLSNYLVGVSCVTATACMAAGFYGTLAGGFVTLTLTERYS